MGTIAFPFSAVTVSRYIPWRRRGGGVTSGEGCAQLCDFGDRPALGVPAVDVAGQYFRDFPASGLHRVGAVLARIISCVALARLSWPLMRATSLVPPVIDFVWHL